MSFHFTSFPAISLWFHSREAEMEAEHPPVIFHIAMEILMYIMYMTYPSKPPVRVFLRNHRVFHIFHRYNGAQKIHHDPHDAWRIVLRIMRVPGAPTFCSLLWPKSIQIFPTSGGATQLEWCWLKVTGPLDIPDGGPTWNKILRKNM